MSWDKQIMMILRKFQRIDVLDFSEYDFSL